jgi:hypothetical protein
MTFTGVSVVFGTISKVSQQYLVRALPEPEPAGGAAAAAAAAAAGAGAVGGGGGRSADVSRYSVGTKAQLFQSLSSDPSSTLIISHSIGMISKRRKNMMSNTRVQRHQSNNMTEEKKEEICHRHHRRHQHRSW